MKLKPYHCQSAVLHFVGLVCCQFGRVFPEAKRVELEITRKAVALPVNHLDDGGKGHDFKEGAPQQNLGKRAVENTPVMAVDSDLWSVSIEWEGYDLCCDQSNNGEHADATMFNFSFLQPFDVHEGGDTQRVCR